jgi:hypothetical protein
MAVSEVLGWRSKYWPGQWLSIGHLEVFGVRISAMSRNKRRMAYDARIGLSFLLFPPLAEHRLE